MAELKFSDLKEQILSVLNNRIRNGSLKFDEQVTIVDGFAYLPVQQNIGGPIAIGGRNIPMVVLWGKRSGKLYFFALKDLLPNVQI